MGKDLGLLVCLAILAMDIAAGVISIEAEIKQNKVKHAGALKSECRDSSHEAFKLGLSAAVFLALSHFMAHFFGGCTWLRSKQEFEKASPNKTLAVGCLIFSWILLAVGFSVLVTGTLANSRSRKFCGLPHHQIFIIGGVFCFLHGLFIVSYYVSATATAREEQRRHATQETQTHGSHA